MAVENKGQLVFAVLEVLPAQGGKALLPEGKGAPEEKVVGVGLGDFELSLFLLFEYEDELGHFSDSVSCEESGEVHPPNPQRPTSLYEYSSVRQVSLK